MLNTKLSFDY